MYVYTYVKDLFCFKRDLKPWIELSLSAALYCIVKLFFVSISTLVYCGHYICNALGVPPTNYNFLHYFSL